MRPRLVLLPGFGENCSVYNPLLPYFTDYELVRVEYPDILNKVPFWNFSGFEIAKVISETYDLNSEDKLIGHSTGGYFAFLLREMMGNEICMISGFSDCAKIIHPLPYTWFTTPFLGITGFVKSALARRYMLNKVKDKPIAIPMKEAMLQMKDYSNMDLFKLSVILRYDEKPVSVLAHPLRIHARDDKLVKLPDEPYTEVSGGHFPIALDTSNVALEMKGFLELQ